MVTAVVDPWTVTQSVELTCLEREIATDCARTDIECKARTVSDLRYLGAGVHRVCEPVRMPIYDVAELEPGGYTDPDLVAADRADVARAVRYLDMRGLLLRPFADRPNLVAFREPAP